jgi:hypothetical protein
MREERDGRPLLLSSQAVEKFTEALELDPRKHETLWCLGNAYTSQVRLPFSPLPQPPVWREGAGFSDACKCHGGRGVDLRPALVLAVH